MNGVTITAKIDGFRRGGIAHSAAGTHYPEGYFSESQLEAFRQEPQLVVVEGVVEVSGDDDIELRLVAADQQRELLSDMVETLTGRLADAEDLVQTLANALSDQDTQLAAMPELIVLDLLELERADPTQQGVLCLKADDVVAVIKRFTQALIQNPEHGNAGTTTAGAAAGTSETAPGAASAAPVPQAPAADALPVTDQKPAGGKAARAKPGKDSGKQEGDNA
nr:HI1506-related protein [uncultured Pseudomonas sp.]